MEKEKFSLSSATLHIFAMCCMLLDHIWGVGLANGEWLTCVGRLAFPIFAFMIAEGWNRTKNKKAYAMRLLIAALVSEIPFNLMMSGSVFYPFAQNVLWTFLIAIACMAWIDRERTRHGASALKISLVIMLAVLAGYAAGFAGFTDYYGAGVVTVLVFYLFPARNAMHMAMQFVCLFFLHAKMLGGLVYPMSLGPLCFEIPRQAIALLALVPIWLYRGRQGYHKPWFRWFCYGFYPVHMLVLYLLALL